MVTTTVYHDVSCTHNKYNLIVGHILMTCTSFLTLRNATTRPWHSAVHKIRSSLRLGVAVGLDTSMYMARDLDTFAARWRACGEVRRCTLFDSHPARSALSFRPRRLRLGSRHVTRRGKRSERDVLVGTGCPCALPCTVLASPCIQVSILSLPRGTSSNGRR